ncbi:hypothetical protein NG796_08665 [Laspinema sp. A4]|nr:hypothetical protein [Laspinema sp. D2d]
MTFVFGSLLAASYGFVPLFTLIFCVLGVVIYAWFFVQLIEIYSLFFIYENSLAMEKDITSFTTINRSRQLFKGVRRFVVKKIILAVCATIPLTILTLLL